MRARTVVALGMPVLGAAFAAGRLVGRAQLRAARQAALVDPLTGLANRPALYAALRRLAVAGPSYAVLVCDLDGFKAVNDAHGHAGGDAVLVTVAGRLTRLVGAAGTVARLGGDEFAIIARSIAPGASTLLAHEVARRVAAPIRVNGHPVAVRASVGVVHARPGDDPRRLLHAADLAMYEAKTTGCGMAEYGTLRPPAEVTERPALRVRELAAGMRELVGVGR